ncbi:alcohol dehydrogenase catalytic domain-containing protein [Sphingomonas montanisoli]|uniref:alcohol dehydrogenase catalytic domain-containing protein n=1 Tax=Sphingomonas montanisoli TaxID=2606412 RepID=UPI001FE85419|nr:alcohol dehydrogenase catalytic domain-containing protein [Sphingomonas montanisoli]
MMIETRAAVCHAPDAALTIETVQLAPPGPGEVLIEICACGICHSDHHQRLREPPSGLYPIILGHEGAGVVRECGPGVESVRPGDHVIPLSIAECGVCANCRSGRTNICEAFLADMRDKRPRFFLNGEPVAVMSNNGAFAQHMVMPERQVAKIRDDVPLDIACAIGCAVATGVGAALHTARVREGSNVVIFGLGGVGVNVAQGARVAGASRIIGVDVNPDRGAAAAQFGVTDFVDARAHGDRLVDHLRALTGGGADYCFECVGDATLMNQAIEVSHIGWGMSVLLGVLDPSATLPVPLTSLQIGRTVTGSYMGNMRGRTQLPGLLDLYVDGRILLDPFITHRLPIGRINEGFDLMLSGQALRAAVTF